MGSLAEWQLLVRTFLERAGSFLVSQVVGPTIDFGVMKSRSAANDGDRRLTEHRMPGQLH